MLNKNMKYGFNLLFGLPVYRTKINSDEYNKQNIVETILENFNKKEERNVWSTDPWGKKIHQSLHDDSNPIFKIPDYSGVSKLYFESLKDFLKNLNINQDVRLNLQVINYTIANFQSIMEPHIHGASEFSMIHYVKFDPKEHAPTTFLNPYNFYGYNVRMEKLAKKMHLNNLTNSWNVEEWTFNTEEDDLIIFPAVLKHMVKNRNSKKMRITVAANVEIH